MEQEGFVEVVGWSRSVPEEPTGMGKGEVALEAKPTLGHEEGAERRPRHTSAERAEPRQQLGLWASDFHAAVTRSGGERSWSCAAVNRWTTAIGPPQLGQRHSGCAVGVIDVSDSCFGGVEWRAAKHRGSRAARLRLARKPKWRMRTKPLGSGEVRIEAETHRAIRASLSAEIRRA